MHEAQQPEFDESQLQDLEAISGQSREDCIRALRAARGDPNLAFEVLQNGLPEPDEASVNSDEPEAPHQNVFEALASNQNFQAIRQRIVSDPAFFNQFMQQLQQTQPQLYAMIQQNPAAFVQTVLGGQVPAQQQAFEEVPEQISSLAVSRQEIEAIERLEQLGFTRERAAEAYFACDKNEEMAANFLFEHG